MAKAKHVSEGMIIAASNVLAECVTKEELEANNIYPKVERAREISEKIAIAVIKKAKEEKLTSLAEDAEKYVGKRMYQPKYSEYQ